MKRSERIRDADEQRLILTGGREKRKRKIHRQTNKQQQKVTESRTKLEGKLSFERRREAE